MHRHLYVVSLRSLSVLDNQESQGGLELCGYQRSDRLESARARALQN